MLFTNKVSTKFILSKYFLQKNDSTLNSHRERKLSFLTNHQQQHFPVQYMTKPDLCAVYCINYSAPREKGNLVGAENKIGRRRRIRGLCSCCGKVSFRELNNFKLKCWIQKQFLCGFVNFCLLKTDRRNTTELSKLFLLHTGLNC